jgi:mono/diheme cytochrome c family protein
LKFVAGLVLGIILVPVMVYFYFAGGSAPVATTDADMPFEAMLARKAQHARIDKEMPKTVPIPANEANYLAGAELYKQHCAVCHGDDLKGTGPVPPPSRVPPNLTTMARRYGGKFPDAYVSKVLRNGVTLPAHGPAEMPVWGTVFEAADQLDMTQVDLRIKRLINFIKSRQVKEGSKVISDRCRQADRPMPE